MTVLVPPRQPRRRRRRWLAAVPAALLLTACGASTPGIAVTQPWTPLPDTATATAVVTDEPEFIAVSADLTMAIRQQDGHPACWVPQTAPDEPGVCAEVPDALGRVPAAISPDASRYLLFQAPSYGRASAGPWIVEASTGTVTPIDLGAASAGPGMAAPSASAAGASSAASAESPSAASPAAPSSSSDPSSNPSVIDLQWNGNDQIIGLTSVQVLRIDATTGAGEVLATLPDEERVKVGSMAIGGSSLAVLRGTSLVRVDLATGSLTALTVQLGDERRRSILMGISPDGARALVSTTDVTRFLPGPASVVGLEDGSMTEIPGTATSFVLAGGFSPDGTQLVLMAAALKSDASGSDPDSRQGLLLAPADAASPDAASPDSASLPVVIGPVDRTVYGAMRWSRTNVVSSTDTGFGVRGWRLAG